LGAINKSETLNLAIRTHVFVVARNFDRWRIIHSSLPNPIKLKIRIFDIEKKNYKEIIIPVSDSTPYEIVTLESKQKEFENNQNDKLDFFATCDDVDSEARMYVQFVNAVDCYSDSKILKYSNSCGCCGKYFYQEQLREIVYLACKEGKSEYVIPDCDFVHNQFKDCSIRLIALLDLENRYVYGFRIEMKIGASETVAHYKIPDDFMN